MNKHALPLLCLAGACAAGIVFSEIVVANEAPAHGAAGDIVAVASGDPDFATLVTALKAAGLSAALQAKGPFTVFAPDNAAFAGLPAGALGDLLEPANRKKPVRILENHVVQGKVMAADVKSGRVKTLQGGKVSVAVDNGGVRFGGAQVVATDIPVSNGVIHVIDTVVMPD